MRPEYISKCLIQRAGSSPSLAPLEISFGKAVPGVLTVGFCKVARVRKGLRKSSGATLNGAAMARVGSQRSFGARSLEWS